MEVKTNCFFEVVPETYSNDTVEETTSDVLVEYIDKARQDGFGETVIERAAQLCNENVRPMTTF